MLKVLWSNTDQLHDLGGEILQWRRLLELEHIIEEKDFLLMNCKTGIILWTIKQLYTDSNSKPKFRGKSPRNFHT